MQKERFLSLGWPKYWRPPTPPKTGQALNSTNQPPVLKCRLSLGCSLHGFSRFQSPSLGNQDLRGQQDPKHYVPVAKITTEVDEVLQRLPEGYHSRLNEDNHKGNQVFRHLGDVKSLCRGHFTKCLPSFFCCSLCLPQVVCA